MYLFWMKCIICSSWEGHDFDESPISLGVYRKSEKFRNEIFAMDYTQKTDKHFLVANKVKSNCHNCLNSAGWKQRKGRRFSPEAIWLLGSNLAGIRELEVASSHAIRRGELRVKEQLIVMCVPPESKPIGFQNDWQKLPGSYKTGWWRSEPSQVKPQALIELEALWNLTDQKSLEIGILFWGQRHDFETRFGWGWVPQE